MQKGRFFLSICNEAQNVFFRSLWSDDTFNGKCWPCWVNQASSSKGNNSCCNYSIINMSLLFLTIFFVSPGNVRFTNVRRDQPSFMFPTKCYWLWSCLLQPHLEWGLVHLPFFGHNLPRQLSFLLLLFSEYCSVVVICHCFVSTLKRGYDLLWQIL